jgi:hypothetical protein
MDCFYCWINCADIKRSAIEFSGVARLYCDAGLAIAIASKLAPTVD